MAQSGSESLGMGQERQCASWRYPETFFLDSSPKNPEPWIPINCGYAPVEFLHDYGSCVNPSRKSHEKSLLLSWFLFLYAKLRVGTCRSYLGPAAEIFTSTLNLEKFSRNFAIKLSAASS